MAAHGVVQRIVEDLGLIAVGPGEPWENTRVLSLGQRGYVQWTRVAEVGIPVHVEASDARVYDDILDTFPIVKRKDVAAHGEYRTMRLILENCDAMQTAIDTGSDYQTILNPPPGHGPRHPAKES